MSETQVLMTVSNFSEFFLGIISWKGVLLCSENWFSVGEGFAFKWGVPHGGISFDKGGGF